MTPFRKNIDRILVAITLLGVLSIVYSIYYPAATEKPHDAQIIYLRVKEAIRLPQERIEGVAKKTNSLKDSGRDFANSTIQAPQLGVPNGMVLADGEIVVKALISDSRAIAEREIILMFLPELQAGGAIHWRCVVYPPELMSGICSK